MSALNGGGDANQSQSSHCVDSIVFAKGTFPLPRCQTPVTPAHAASYFQHWNKALTRIQQAYCVPPSATAKEQSGRHAHVDVNAYMLQAGTKPAEAVHADTGMLSNCAAEGQPAAAEKKVQCPPSGRHSPDLTGVHAVQASAVGLVHRLRLGSQIRPGFHISAEVKRACYSRFEINGVTRQEIAKGQQPVRIASTKICLLQSVLAVAESKQQELLKQVPPRYCEFTTIRILWYHILQKTASSQAEDLTDSTMATAATQMAVDWIQGHQHMLGTLLPFVGIDLVSDDELDIQPDMEMINSLMPDCSSSPSTTAAATTAAEPQCQPLSDPAPSGTAGAVKLGLIGLEPKAAGHHRQAEQNASPSGDVPTEEVQGPTHKSPATTSKGPVCNGKGPAPIGKIPVPRRKSLGPTPKEPFPTETVEVPMLGADFIGSTQHWQPRSPVTQCNCESCKVYQTGQRTLLPKAKPFTCLPV